jgi:hypothetical protein
MDNEKFLQLALDNGQYLIRRNMQHLEHQKKANLERGDTEEYEELLETFELAVANQHFLIQLYKSRKTEYDKQNNIPLDG